MDNANCYNKQKSHLEERLVPVSLRRQNSGSKRKKGPWEKGIGGLEPSFKHCDFPAQFLGHWKQQSLPPSWNLGTALMTNAWPGENEGSLGGCCVSTVKAPMLQHGVCTEEEQVLACLLTSLLPAHRPPGCSPSGLCMEREGIKIPGKPSQLTTLTNICFHSQIWIGSQELVYIWTKQVSQKMKTKMSKYNFQPPGKKLSGNRRELSVAQEKKS